MMNIRLTRRLKDGTAYIKPLDPDCGSCDQRKPQCRRHYKMIANRLAELEESEEKYKLALFMVIRNSKVMPQGLRLGRSMTEINRMAVQTMSRDIEMIDYDNAAKSFEEGIK
ncbi:hypothetical protein [Emergencia sp.]|uniref:hypothetical protein n=1 Tax=Emergencia sp. TaxID=1926557 RepID=UPI003AEFBD09